MNKLIKINK